MPNLGLQPDLVGTCRSIDRAGAGQRPVVDVFGPLPLAGDLLDECPGVVHGILVVDVVFPSGDAVEGYCRGASGVPYVGYAGRSTLNELLQGMPYLVTSDL